MKVTKQIGCSRVTPTMRNLLTSPLLHKLQVEKHLLGCVCFFQTNQLDVFVGFFLCPAKANWSAHIKQYLTGNHRWWLTGDLTVGCCNLQTFSTWKACALWLAPSVKRVAELLSRRVIRAPCKESRIQTFIHFINILKFWLYSWMHPGFCKTEEDYHVSKACLFSFLQSPRVLWAWNLFAAQESSYVSIVCCGHVYVELYCEIPT